MKFYIPLLSALIIYSLLSFFWGETGLQSLKQMEQQKYQLKVNLSELNKINQKLNDDLLSLGSDPERITIQSRNLGYIEKDEKLLYINSQVNPSGQLDVGRILDINLQIPNYESVFKWITFIFLMISMGISLISNQRKRTS